MNTDLKHRTLSAAIAERLRQDILSGIHPSGAQLRQDALAGLYGVSRIPVREALFLLESEGLVQMVPHKGAVVTRLSLAEINDVFDLRSLLEPRLFRQSIPALVADDFARIDEIQKAFTRAIRARDIRQSGTINAEFHAALYARAALPRTASTVLGLLQASDRYTRVQLSSPAAMKRAEREHAELVALARKRRAADACALLKRHIEAVRVDLLALMTWPPAATSAKALTTLLSTRCS
jgi:DNA-binding GntR family transcriptional regulator